MTVPISREPISSEKHDQLFSPPHAKQFERKIGSSPSGVHVMNLDMLICDLTLSSKNKMKKKKKRGGGEIKRKKNILQGLNEKVNLTDFHNSHKNL